MEDRRQKIIDELWDRYKYTVSDEITDDFIKDAMDVNMRECCLELLQFMIDKQVDINWHINDKRSFLYKGEWITKEQLFEIFL